MNRTEKILREYIVECLRESKKKKKRPDNYESGTAKNLYLDKPFMVGGWPKGRYEGWVAGPPVNVQIRDYLKKMGLLQ
jgi:hypothetical protein